MVLLSLAYGENRPRRQSMLIADDTQDIQRTPFSIYSRKKRPVILISQDEFTEYLQARRSILPSHKVR